ncbi:dTMP kinase [Nakamurella sp. YIM 132087]|uniref:Thymidylate kinase n=1 Tax=Nakamurella alba TaxID=2665158 RepID=A0A7K1FFW8_9ACTN|nr:dTMP kinase [Nakamurella alba]MTD12966.1 dTMP kinase [Nakamurella alba]
MGRLIVVEGLDGSGKQTLTRKMTVAAEARGLEVARLGFPRYGDSIFADLCQDALYGRLGDLSDSVHGTAMLFALDRRDAARHIRNMLRSNDLVILDRYVSSNAAYGSARLGGPEQDHGFPEWVRELEIDRFGVPVPDLQLLLATSVELSAERARSRAETDADRALDRFEADTSLQHRTGQMYRELAAAQYLSPWQVLAPDDVPDVRDLLG